MDSYRHLLDPDDMTPEERLDEILSLLAKASVRLAEAERRGEVIPETVQSFAGSAAAIRARGRMPFGQSKGRGGRVADRADQTCIARIRELAAEGLSLRQIADNLNREDTGSRYAGRWSRCAVWRILGRAKQIPLDFPAKSRIPSMMRPGKGLPGGAKGR